MADKPLLTREVASQLIAYNPDTGSFTWLPRPPEMFVSQRMCSSWNSRYAGKTAGEFTKGRHVKITLKCMKLGYRGAVLAHRLAFLMMTGEWPVDAVDHINGDKVDNRWSNLRQCSIAENNLNRRKVGTVNGKVTSSAYRGVYYYRPTRKYVVHIRIPNVGTRGRGKQIHVGYYKCEVDAALAYDEVARKYHGEFARLNFPNA